MARFIILSLVMCQVVDPDFPRLQELNLPSTLRS